MIQLIESVERLSAKLDFHRFYLEELARTTISDGADCFESRKIAAFEAYHDLYPFKIRVVSPVCCRYCSGFVMSRVQFLITNLNVDGHCCYPALHHVLNCLSLWMVWPICCSMRYQTSYHFWKLVLIVLSSSAAQNDQTFANQWIYSCSERTMIA